MSSTPSGRRRIDRVSAPDLLDGLSEHPVAVLRSLRDECREEEAELSYARRVVHGQLDIARAELRRRRGEEPQDDGDDPEALVKRLVTILADAPPTGARQARSVGMYQPSDSPHRRSSDVSELISLGRLPDLETAEIEDLVERLEAEEQKLSKLRRAVLDNLDALQAELVLRYREGEADLDAILSTALPDKPER